MKKTIVDTLKSGFDGKVNPWVHKVFESMKKHIFREKRMNYVDQSQQTEVLMDLMKKRSEYAANC
jgi:translation elongation factor P/translation initiation factor 5A